MKDVMLLLFATTAGFAVSGIVANLYRILTTKEQRKRASYYIVMVLAGPSVLFENATKSFRAKKCSRLTYGFAVAITGYWAFALGLLVIQLGILAHVLKHTQGLF